MERNERTGGHPPREGGLHPAVAQTLRYFAWQHLPAQLQEVSKPFADLAHLLAHTIDPVPQLTISLNKLLEAKDAAVRAALPPE